MWEEAGGIQELPQGWPTQQALSHSIPVSEHRDHPSESEPLGTWPRAVFPRSCDVALQLHGRFLHYRV